MKEAIIKESFSIIQWHGKDYPYYEENAERNTFEVGEKVLILHEAKANPMGRLFVVFNERIKESAVVSETYLEFVNEDHIETENEDDYEWIDCSECDEHKAVEKGTWALDKGMCEHCYCIYQGG